MLKILLGILLVLSVNMTVSADLFGKAGKLYNRITEGDVYDKLTKTEIDNYLKSKDRCAVKHGDKTMKTGITSYNNWQRAFNKGVKKEKDLKMLLGMQGKPLVICINQVVRMVGYISDMG